MAWGGPSWESMTPEDQADSRVRVLETRVQSLERENVGLQKRNDFLEECLTRDLLNVFDENERLKREHEEMRLRLVGWQTGNR